MQPGAHPVRLDELNLMRDRDDGVGVTRQRKRHSKRAGTARKDRRVAGRVVVVDPSKGELRDRIGEVSGSGSRYTEHDGLGGWASVRERANRKRAELRVAVRANLTGRDPNLVTPLAVPVWNAEASLESRAKAALDLGVRHAFPIFQTRPGAANNWIVCNAGPILDTRPRGTEAWCPLGPAAAEHESKGDSQDSANHCRHTTRCSPAAIVN